MTLPEKFEKFCIDSTDCNGCIGLDCRMCEEMYTAGYKAALEDMGVKPDGMEIDRIDNSKGYYKENCRWATREHNQANRMFKSKKGLPRGVIITPSGKYRATISENNSTKYLGCYNTIEEAISSYNDAYKAKYGELPPEERHMLVNTNEEESK